MAARAPTPAPPSPATRIEQRLGATGARAFVSREHTAPKDGAEQKAAQASTKAAAPVHANLHAAMAPLAHALHARARSSSHHKAGKEATVASAQRAAISPRNEQARGAATQTVEKLSEAQTEKLQREEFKTKLRSAVDAEMHPATSESEAKKVMNEGAARASITLRGGLQQEREAAAGGLREAAKSDVTADSQPALKQVELQTEAAGPPLAPVDAKPAVPPPLPAEKLDYSSDRAPTDQLMAQNQVTNGQLQEGNDPAFGPALGARADAEKHEAAAEPLYRKEEAKVQATAEGQARAIVHGGLTAIHGTRGTELGKVGGQQEGVRTADAAKRAQITVQITTIKDRTKSDIEQILTRMDTDAAATFDAGLQRASDRYESAFSDAKGGVGTWLTTWGDDWDQLITAALGTARAAYMQEVDAAIEGVATIVDNSLREAKARVAQGRREVDDVVNKLEGEMRTFGDQAKEAVEADFGALETQINDRRDALVNRLSEQLRAAYQKMNAREEELREANKSLWRRVYDATVGLVKKIIEFKNLLFSVLAKAAAVIGDIIAHPIRFLGNLVGAVGQGLKNFIAHIGTHLQKGLMDWLFGALAGGGLKLPEKFDLEGIVSIVLQLLGLTYENFRARAVGLLGEEVVAALEKGAEVFMIFMKEGITGIWRFIKDKVSDLKSMVLDAIFDFIKDKVISAGITWIIGLLNPASAFFKACKAIYDIIVFMVNRAAQMVTFVNAVIDSVAAIASGSLGAAITAVEDALARAIPVAIGMLASLLGLGDPSKPVKTTIEKAQTPIGKAIDWVIHGAVKLVKTAGKLVKGLVGKKEPPRATDHAGAEVDPKAMAQRELEARLHKESTLADVEQAVNTVRTQLAPAGLHQLIVKKGPGEADYQIFAAASELECLFALHPKFYGISTQMVARVTMSDALPMKGITDISDSSYRLESQKRLTGDREQALFASPSHSRSTTIGGKAIIPKAGETHIDLVSWNIGEKGDGIYESHAEFQFFTWLSRQHDSWLGRVTEINLSISRSPCGGCTGDVLTHVAGIPGLPPGVVRKIEWRSLHRGALPTTQDDVRKLVANKWQVNPASPMPGKPSEAEKMKLLTPEPVRLPSPGFKKRGHR